MMRGDTVVFIDPAVDDSAIADWERLDYVPPEPPKPRWTADDEELLRQLRD